MHGSEVTSCISGAIQPNEIESLDRSSGWSQVAEVVRGLLYLGQNQLRSI
jgi:hypothetical protein